MSQVEIGGVRIAYDVQGDGEPVLLLTSAGMRKEAWLASVVPHLLEAGHQAVTFDLRGIGGSDAPPPPYTVTDIAADTVGVIGHLGLAPCRIVGFSLGGFAAEELAATRPELVRAAVFLASATPTTSYGRLVVASGLEVATSGIQLPQREQIKDVLGEIFTPPQLQDDAFVDAWVQVLEGTPEWPSPGRHGQYAAALAWIDGGGEAGRRAAISAPVLVVAFEDDVVLPAASAREAAGAVADGEFVLISGAGHGGPFTHAADVAEHLIRFFART